MNAVTVTTQQQLWQREAEAFRKIPGMDLLLRSQRETLPDLEVKYPDAAFACMIALSDQAHVGLTDSRRNRKRPLWFPFGFHSGLTASAGPFALPVGKM